MSPVAEGGSKGQSHLGGWGKGKEGLGQGWEAGVPWVPHPKHTYGDSSVPIPLPAWGLASCSHLW